MYWLLLPKPNLLKDEQITLKTKLFFNALGRPQILFIYAEKDLAIDVT